MTFGRDAENETPTASENVVQYRNLRIEFDEVPTQSANTLPSGASYVSYSQREITLHGAVSKYVFFTAVGSVTSAEDLLEKEVNLVRNLRQTVELSEALDFNGYPAAKIISTSQKGDSIQRTAVQSLVVENSIVKLRIVGNAKDVTLDVITDFFGRVQFL